MGSGSHSPYRDPDIPVADLLPPPSLIDQRELDRLTAPRSLKGGTGQAAWRPSVIQGGHCGRPSEAKVGSVRSHPGPSAGQRVIDTRAVVRIGLAAAFMAALLVVFSIPRAGAEHGPLPAVSHVVQPGDTLWSIAEIYTPATGDIRATVSLIRSANEATSSLLIVGDVIEVPGALSRGPG